MTEEDAPGHNNALQRERKERVIKEQRQKGGSLNPFNDALYIAFLVQVVHHRVTATDFIFRVLTTGMYNHIGLFWSCTVDALCHKSHSLFSVSDNISHSSLKYKGVKSTVILA